ncbi:RidA family protein [Leeia sp.]|uniref:RidA family protein n=1 Tax=Leeia sp. TaxID=2884678 RepID=UPI0035B38A4D
MSEIERIGVTPRWSDVVMHGDTIYLVEVADQTLEGDITAQTQEVLASIERRLQAVGSGKHRLLQVLIYLPDLADLTAMNALWDAWLPAGAAPSRACVQAALAHPSLKVEMVVTAAR